MAVLRRLAGLAIVVVVVVANIGHVWALAAQQYLVGVGIGDITGPVVETNMMGYADLSQSDTGLLMRQFSRSFIISSSPSLKELSSNSTVLIINSDIGMGDNGIRRQLLFAIENDSVLRGYYNTQNIAWAGTHSHSGVGGYLENLLPQITSLGYVKQTADAIVAGTLASIRQAHASLSLAELAIGNTTLMNSNTNRSPTAYLQNPASERSQYPYDVDKELSLLRLGSRGFINWFPVHGTSIYQNNTLVSTDNKGYAAFLSESKHDTAFPGKNSFVAGYMQSNVGDTSPNTLGAFCESPGQRWHGQSCEATNSTCGGAAKDCHGRGPAYTVDPYGIASSNIIGTNQFNAAESLYASPSLAPVRGDVRSVHIYVNMSSYSFTLPNGTAVKTCPPAMGYSFAGGTTDGPGTFNLTQGNNKKSQNALWEVVKGFVTPYPDQEQKSCHGSKPILLNTGYAHLPYEWQPSIVSVQLLRIGQVVVIAMPGELTTMAGRRLRNTVRSAIISSGILGYGTEEPYVVIAGLANSYSHYVTTREEYEVQRYEGASTIYGPYTLEAYQDIYKNLVPWLSSARITGSMPTSAAAPTDESGKYLSFQLGVIQDGTPLFQKFGQIVNDVNTNASYSAGQTVSATFVGANPRNNLRLGGTFLTIEKQDGDGSTPWKAVKTDAFPSTKYEWKRENTILGTSTVTISWTIEGDTPPGNYRIVYYGDSKYLLGDIKGFTGTSSVFTVK